MGVSLSNLRLTPETRGAGCGLKLSLSCVEYFQLNGRSVKKIITIEGRTLLYGDTTVDVPASRVALKVLSYITLLFPLIVSLILLGAWCYYSTLPSLPDQILWSDAIARLKNEIAVLNQNPSTATLAQVTEKTAQIATLNQKCVDYYKGRVDELVNTHKANFQLTNENKNLLVDDFIRLNAADNFCIFGVRVLTRDELITYRDQMWTDKAGFARSLTVVRECSIKFKPILEEVCRSAINPDLKRSIVDGHMKKKYTDLIKESLEFFNHHSVHHVKISYIIRAYEKAKVDELLNNFENANGL